MTSLLDPITNQGTQEARYQSAASTDLADGAHGPHVAFIP